MVNANKKINRGVEGASQSPQFRRTKINAGVLAVLGALSFLPSSSAWAADDTKLAELQQENQRLRKELEALRGGQKAPVPATATESAVDHPVAGRQGGDSTTELERVVVSGKKTLLRVKEIPQSISIVSGEDLKREGVSTLEDGLKRLSNVKWNYGNTSTSSYSMRGLGKTGNVDGADPSVGISLDGVGLAFNQFAYSSLYDIDSIEAVHGPLGTQGGKNSTIGGIKINYKRPTFSNYQEVSVGFTKYEKQNYNNSNGSVRATAVANGVIAEDLLAFRASVDVNKGGGWIPNSYNPDNTYIGSDRVNARLQLLLKPTPDFDARLVAEVMPRNSENVNINSTNFFFSPTPTTYANGAANTALTNEARLARSWFTRNVNYTLPGNWYNQGAITSDSQQGVVSGSNSLGLELNWVVADKYRLSSNSSYKDYVFNAFRDDEGTVFDVQTAAGQNKVFRQYTQDFQVASSIDNLVDYQAGLFVQKVISRSQGNNIYGSDAGAWYATNAQYNALAANNLGANTAAGRYLLVDSLNDLWIAKPTLVDNQTTALYANGDWRITDALKVNTGVRRSWEDRDITQEANLQQNGYGKIFNSGANGGFDTVSSTNGNLTAAALADPNQLAAADLLAQRYFGATDYAALTTAQKTLVANAKAIRNSQIGTLYGRFSSNYKGSVDTFTIAPKYKLNDNVTAYVSFSYGEKAGLPTIRAANNPYALDVKPEKNTGIELGVKTNLLNGDLAFNASLYLNDIKDYQQSVGYEDTVATARNGVTTYASGFGNVNKVRTQGLEVDGVYSGIKDVVIRFAGAYNDAHYVDFKNATCPVERANECTNANPYLDYSGRTLPGASKYSFNIGATHNWSLANGKVFRSGFTTTYQSRWNSDNSLSDYAWVAGNYVTDVNFSYADARDRWTTTFFVKNVFNDDTVRNQTWNASAPGFPRQYGLVFSSKL